MSTLDFTTTILNNISLLNHTNDSDICACCPYGKDPCGSGLLLPILVEVGWPLPVRAGLYLAGLLWCFLGVAIIADIFMCAIEKITSQSRTIKIASEESSTGYDEIEVKIWNDTVANLTLMALGSSAPEILLSCIEIVGKEFRAGELGPGTIVGSAAFNLFCITAVCVLGVPSNATRRIEKFSVFLLTSIISIFAYAWLVVILILVTPDVMDLWEALLTLAFFPILVILAYLADNKCFCKGAPREGTPEGQNLSHANKMSNFIPWGRGKRKKRKDRNGGYGVNEDRMREIIKELEAIHPHLKEDEIIQLATAKLADEQPHDRLWYRINATKQFGGNPRLTPRVNARLSRVYQCLKRQEEEGKKLEPEEVNSILDALDDSGKSVIEFTAAQSAILERDERVRVSIRRIGKIDQPASCMVETIDGSAEATKDYIPINQPLNFAPGETIKHIDIGIIDDNVWEPDEVFFVKLYLDPEDPDSRIVKLGKRAIQEITILNDDDPGVFEFEKPSCLFKESEDVAQIGVVRSNGADGKVEVKWKTEDLTAVNGRDYQGGEGTLVFEHGETTKMIEIPITNDRMQEKNESFKVDLIDVDCEGAKIGRVRKTIVTIVDDDEFSTLVNRMMLSVNMNMDAIKVDASTWADQFRNSMNVNGGDLDNAATMDYVMHFLTFPWKFIFAFVPPPYMCNGWLSFVISLLMIGVLTAIVGDLAAIFGCLVGLKDSVTAITFVALGTSLPDLFASKQAAAQEKTADNAIGNVMGSNSVNVFLGLGLPWVIAAVYWHVKGEVFPVPAGSLGFSVIVFIVCACICFVTLLLRRYMGLFGKAELGGPCAPRWFSGIFFVFLWLVYVLLSSLEAYEHIKIS